MKKVIISIFVFSLFGSFAFAQDSQNDSITSNLTETVESVVPARNEAGAEVEVNTNLSELEIGTSATLTKTVDEILKNSSNFSSLDWCRDASSFVGDLPQNVKQTLAWNSGSYTKVVEYVPEDEAIAGSYKSAQTAYTELNVALDEMMSNLLADQAAGRFVAMARSSAIEALVEFKSGDVDQDRLNGLAEVAKRSVECASPENSDIALQKLNALFGTDFASANTEEVVETPAYPVTKISSKDVTGETTMIDIETVSDIGTMKAYVLGVMSENGKVVSVEDREDSVTIRYETDAKFLGFIKSKTNAKVMIADDLTVKVNYPFFSFLASKSFKVNAEEMTNALKAAFDVTDESVDVEVSILKGDFGAKAKAVTTVTDILKASQEVSAVVADEVTEEVVGEEMPTQEDGDVVEVIVEDSSAAGGTVLEGAPVIEGVDVSVQ